LVSEWDTFRLIDLIPECDPYLFVTSNFLLTPFVMNFSQLSEENSYIELIIVYYKLRTNSKGFYKELKKVNQERVFDYSAI
jgi:hypothetical protein